MLDIILFEHFKAFLGPMKVTEGRLRVCQKRSMETNGNQWKLAILVIQRSECAAFEHAP